MFFKKLQEYFDACKLYKEYLRSLEHVHYDQFEKFVDIDYSYQQSLQPKKIDYHDPIEFRITFNAKILKIKKVLNLDESFSYLDPDLKLFNNDEKLYENFNQIEKNKQNKRNIFIYEQLKNKNLFNERYSDLELKRTVIGGWSLKSYLSSIRIQNMHYEKFDFFNKLVKVYETKFMIRNHILNKINTKNEGLE